MTVIENTDDGVITKVYRIEFEGDVMIGEDGITITKIVAGERLFPESY